MLVVALQALAAAAAGGALFRLWRAALPPQRWLQRVVTAGFLLRAIAGQLLFWISWARLPWLPQLQAGNGIWLFAIDANGYFANASAASSDGLAAIARIAPSQPAVTYVQLLALATRLFGAVTSAGLLINLFSYLGCVALLRRWMSATAAPGARHEASRPDEVAIGNVAITVISLAPSFILWSLQPLKETFFQLLVVAFVCTCAAWQRAWQCAAPRLPIIVALAGTLAIVLAALSGVRWYVAFALLIAALPFLLGTALRARERRGRALAIAAAVAILLAPSFIVGGRGHVPQPVVALLTPATTFTAMADLPALMHAQLAGARNAFDEAGGRTVVQPSRRRATRPPPVAGGDEAQIRDIVAHIIDGWNRGDVEGVVAYFDEAPDVELWLDGRRIAAGAAELRDAYGAIAAAADGESASIANVRVIIDGAAASATGQWRRARRGIAAEGSVTWVLRHADGRWRVVRQMTGKVVAAPAASSANAPASGASSSAASSPAAPAQRRKRFSRFGHGLAAMTIPRLIGEPLGLFHIAGGRGLLWIAEADTLSFDLVLFVAIASIATRFRSAVRDPLTWMLVAMTLLLGVSLAYSVTNFGTLFRLRSAVYLGVILAPAAALAAGVRDARSDR